MKFELFIISVGSGGTDPAVGVEKSNWAIIYYEGMRILGKLIIHILLTLLDSF